MFWVWSAKTTDQADQENQKMDLWLQEFKLEEELEELASPCGDAVVVMKKEEPPSSLSSPLPVRRSPTTPTPQKDADGMWSSSNVSV